MAARRHRPPGAVGVRALTDVFAFARDPLDYVTTMARTHGDIVTMPDIYRRGLYLVHRPDLIHHVLLATNRAYAKGYDRDWALRRLLGHGLVTSEGEQWRRQRQRTQPWFHRRRVEGFAGVMVARTDRMIDRWVDGQPRDLHEDLLQLTMGIIAETMFAVDLGARAADVSRALSDAMDAYAAQLTSGPWGVATMALQAVGRELRPRRFLRATTRIDEAVAALIAERDRGPSGDDLLGHLLTVHGDPGTPELHDEVQSLLLAGHETTANALSWAFVLLSRHPDVVRRLRAEIDSALGDRPPTVDDLDAVPLVRATVMESMRLRPPVWAITRQAHDDVELDGFVLPGGSEVLLSQWVTHRDPRWFELPERFIPQRWLDGLEQRLPKGAYFPFAGGPRSCIGSHFATLEAQLLLIRLLQRVTFEVTGREVTPRPSITLRPTGGLPVRPRLRSSSTPVGI